MARKRLIPDDVTLQAIFREHPDWAARDFLTAYGWPVSRASVLAHRRRILLINPIEGAASISRVEFGRRCDEAARHQHWALTGVDREV